MKSIPLVFFIALSADVLSADSETDNGIPPPQCMSRCEPGRDFCEPKEFDEFPDFDITRSEMVANCPANYLYAVEGMCADGRKMLNAGTGFTSEIRIYTANGEFEGLILQTDHGDRPCMGQFFWPRHVQCESPVVVTNFCGVDFEAGSPAIYNRWEE